MNPAGNVEHVCVIAAPHDFAFRFRTVRGRHVM
jgi:hypothetical protein